MEEIRQRILEKVLKGEYPFWQRMPSERKFAALFGCSQNMVHRALRSLVDENVLICRRGNGYFVAPGNLKNSCSGKKFVMIASNNSPLAIAMRREAGLRKCECVCVPLGNDETATISKIMDDPGVSGIFFMVDVGHSNHWSNFFCRPYREHYPLVSLDAPLINGAMPAVGSNLFRIGFRAAELLYRYGRKGLVCGYERFGHVSLRCSGFVAGCSAYKWADPITCYIGEDSGYQVGDKFFEMIFSRYGGEFDSIFTSTSGMTLGLANYLLKHPELQPGRDFNWLGTDFQQATEGSPFTIDVLVQQFELLARSAFDMMEHAIAQRGSSLVTSQFVDVLYRAGNTINRTKVHK